MRRAALNALIAGAVLTSPMVLAHGQPAVAANGPAGLSIAIHNDSTEVRSGDALTYTVVVENSGSDRVDGRLVVTLPDFVRAVDVGGADRSGADLSWPISVAGGEKVTETVTGRIGEIPADEVRVTTLAGVYLGDASEPAVRTAEADAIAGVADPAHAVADRPATASAGPALGWIIGGAGGVIAAGLLVLVMMARRRQSRLSAGGGRS
ncbi:MAG TPA: hypothetical protein VGO65_07430 [Pseudolysinimonas sp.]|jgi:hypothetical protein|nr:hypothetical protein [Pseudolysinimonas sp.]